MGLRHGWRGGQPSDLRYRQPDRDSGETSRLRAADDPMTRAHGCPTAFDHLSRPSRRARRLGGCRTCDARRGCEWWRRGCAARRGPSAAESPMERNRRSIFQMTPEFLPEPRDATLLAHSERGAARGLPLRRTDRAEQRCRLGTAHLSRPGRLQRAVTRWVELRGGAGRAAGGGRCDAGSVVSAAETEASRQGVRRGTEPTCQAQDGDGDDCWLGRADALARPRWERFFRGNSNVERYRSLRGRT